MKILVQVRAICDFCNGGTIPLEDGRTITCYHCDGNGFFERWDDLEALVNMFLANALE